MAPIRPEDRQHEKKNERGIKEAVDVGPTASPCLKQPKAINTSRYHATKSLALSSEATSQNSQLRNYKQEGTQLRLACLGTCSKHDQALLIRCTGWHRHNPWHPSSETTLSSSEPSGANSQTGSHDELLLDDQSRTADRHAAVHNRSAQNTRALHVARLLVASPHIIQFHGRTRDAIDTRQSRLFLTMAFCHCPTKSGFRRGGQNMSIFGRTRSVST